MPVRPARSGEVLETSSIPVPVSRPSRAVIETVIGPNVLGGFAAGRRAQANHNGSFVFSDSTDAAFSSTVENQFSLRFLNGLFIANDAGNTKSVPVGTRYRDNGVIAWARVAAGGALDSGFNIESVVRNSVGKYTITLRSSASSGFSLVPVVTPEVDPDGVRQPSGGRGQCSLCGSELVRLWALCWKSTCTTATSPSWTTISIFSRRDADYAG